MRILQMGKYYYPVTGGVENHLYTLSTEMAKSNEVVALVSNIKKTKKTDEMKNVKVVRLPKYFSFLNAPVSPGMLFYPLDEFDIVHLHLPNPLASVAVLMGKQKNLIVTYHSDIIKSGIFARFLNFLYTKLVLEKVLERAEKIIVASPNYVEGSKILKKFRKKTVVVSFGVDEKLFGIKNKTKFKELRNKYFGKNVILFVGRFVPYKGLSYLIDAMKEVVPEMKNVILIIVGAGPLNDGLRSRVSSLGLNGHVKFVGELKTEELNYYYHLCDLFVLPSIHRAEAFGIVQLESMVCGKPVISTNIEGSGVSFVNKNGKTGLLVEPKNSSRLASSILYLLKNKKLRRKMGINARKRVLKYFTQKKMMSDILKIYREAVK